MAAITNLFDIVGPAMIGPSSSHTAGAVRIGQIVSRLLGAPVKRADITLFGSFALTYKGHGTDRALAGGLMGMAVDDPRIRRSLDICKENGVEIAFSTGELRGAHPNTARIKAFSAEGKSVEITASSIGGGSITVSEIDGMAVDFSGENDTLIARYKDAPGVVAKVGAALAEGGINIATMKVSRTSAGQSAIMVLELDAPPDKAVIGKIKSYGFMDSVSILDKRV